MMADYREPRWREALETLGEDVVLHRLANRMTIGDGADNLPYDVARNWLAERAARRRIVESVRFWIILLVAVVSAVAALIAALPVINGWIKEPSRVAALSLAASAPAPIGGIMGAWSRSPAAAILTPAKKPG